MVAFLVCFLSGYGAPEAGAVSPSAAALGPSAGADGPGSAVKGVNGGKHISLFFNTKWKHKLKRNPPYRPAVEDLYISDVVPGLMGCKSGQVMLGLADWRITGGS